MGGVEVALTDARTGMVLAKGLPKGGTGDTPRMMRAPRQRGVMLSDRDTLHGRSDLYCIGDYVAERARARDLCIIPTANRLDGQPCSHAANS